MDNTGTSPQLKLLLADFVLGLESASDVQACFDLLAKTSETLGFSGLVYTSIATGVAPLEARGPLFFRSDGFSDAFLSHYQEADFASQDFTIKRIMDDDLQAVNWWREAGAGRLSADEQEVIDVARYDYGMTHGLSVPLLKNDHHMAGCSVVSDDNNETFSQLLDERLGLLKTILRLFHDRVYASPEFQAQLYLPLLQQLNSTERTVLRFLASGLPLKSIEAVAGISPSYAGNVRTVLFRKLGVKNVSELAYIVGLHRILDLL
ncbi:autoinducer binding domain-containing protein [Aliamphritea spongicola]|uniref:autoinducer binding domain-containing protein n=1 Tax=Aliamphritea spongicola TaxID=707589 RepID=UPI00196B3663|nr:autoinducer binding domain-containing protein [Aliamphritea spongicola]MBN3561089.1 autoinducer binding domain-containing protein [Aliamphritea spongicola]